MDLLTPDTLLLKTYNMTSENTSNLLFLTEQQDRVNGNSVFSKWNKMKEKYAFKYFIFA